MPTSRVRSTMSRELSVAAVVKVTDVSARMLPENVVSVPKVADLPTCQ
jgi:hypothetical protein